MTTFRSDDVRSRRVVSWLAALGLVLPVMGWALWTKADDVPMVEGVEFVQEAVDEPEDDCDMGAEGDDAAASALAVCCVTPSGCFTVTGQSCPYGTPVKCPCLQEN